jgi:alcohol dehydrogenase (NADP+)
VGKGLAASHIPRSSIWITSKLWNDAHRPANVKPALKKTLSDLGVDYVDLYLMHWPVAFDPTKKGTVVDNKTSILDTWYAMEELVRAGLAKNIGVSNFAKHQVETIFKHCRICPAAHEFETHPYLQQPDFVKWHHEQGIQVIAYSPFANLNPIYDSKMPPILEDPFFISLAAVKNVTIPQLVLAWGMQRETVVIPKSVHQEWIAENFGALNVQLDETEMQLIALQDKKMRFNNPSKSWGVDLFDDLDGA